MHTRFVYVNFINSRHISSYSSSLAQLKEFISKEPVEEEEVVREITGH